MLGTPRPVLELSFASKHFGEVMAFAGVSFDLRAGDITAIAGPNGGGKTTLLRSIVGLISPDSPHSVKVLGQTPSKHIAVRRYIGYVPDEDDLLDQLSGTEYVQFVAGAYQTDPAAALSRAYKFAAQLELSAHDMRHKLIGSYSHGMRKKTQLIAVLAVQPQLLIIDEPTNGLDPTAVILLKQILLRQSHSAILLASHNLSFAQDIAKHTLLLRQTPLQYGAMKDVLKAHGTNKLEEVYGSLVLKQA